MKLSFTKEEWSNLDFISVYTDLIPTAENCKKEDEYVIDLSDDDWNEVNGFIAAEANHAETKSAENSFDALYNKIEKALYTDN